jgi:hypothetical protein
MAKIAKILFACVLGLGAAALANVATPWQALAQNDTAPPREILRGKNIAPTGETVPHLGAPQIGDESSQEKGAQRRSDHDTHTICSNCD